MAEYKGDALAADFNTVDISAMGRTITVNETADEPEDIDATHKGDTQRNLIEGFPGAVKTDVECEMLDDEADASGLMGFAVNAKDTLLVYPEGKIHTYTMLTISNARLTSRSQNLVYDDVTAISATFHAKNSVTRGTYSSA